jgi:hypothetical protein
MTGGAPADGGVYVALLIATFALHLLLVGFVVGGTGYLVARAVRGLGDRGARRAGGPVGENDVLADRTRDWLPFALGAAITAGVAPLLFVQVLHQPRFYTANLLLFHRWMAIVPALIVGFYLLYLAKSERARRWPRGAQLAIVAAALACFTFVAWTWVENHALAAADGAPGAWVAHYAEGRWFHRSPMVAPRLVMWLALCAPLWAAPAGLMARAVRPGERLRGLAIIALAGLAIAAVAAVIMHGRAPLGLRDGLAAAPGWSYACALAAAAVAAGWLLVLAGRARLGLAVALASSAALAIAIAGAREASRAALRTGPHHDVQGLPTFVVALVLAAAAITSCVVVVRRNLAAARDR